MKKVLLLMMALTILSGCAPAPAATNPPGNAPVSETDLEATAAVLSQQTLQALPTFTVPPSHTPVISTATLTETATQEAGIVSSSTRTLTLAASLAVTTGTGTPPSIPLASPAFTASPTINPLISATLTTTAHPQHYGTMPPYLPSGQITLINKSKTEVYISLHCTTKDGFVSIIETPVNGTTKVNGPAGKYTYVAWVGGRKIVGNFSLDKNGEIRLRIFKDHLEIG
jgi:uncharacterized protein YceK